MNCDGCFYSCSAFSRSADVILMFPARARTRPLASQFRITPSLLHLDRNLNITLYVQFDIDLYLIVDVFTRMLTRYSSVFFRAGGTQTHVIALESGS